jgi:MSHA pilin protein MshC
MSRQTGFTLLELIMVMILIGILAVTAVPRLLNNNVDDYSLRDQLLSRLQLVQTQAMNAVNYSYRVAFYTSTDDDYAGYYRTEQCDSDGDNCSCHPATDSSGSCSSTVYHTSSTLNTGVLRFNALGVPQTCPDGSSSSLTSGNSCTLTMGDLSLQVGSQGYIYAP